MTVDRRLDDKVAIVTGAARGIGRAYALRLAELGANVAIVDRDLRSFTEFPAEQARLKAASVGEEVEQLGRQALELESDVTSRDSMEEMARAVKDRFGRIDVLVCNAGGGSGLLAENQASDLSPADLEATLARNLIGTVNTCSAVAPEMKRANSGKIVTVSSIAGIEALPGGGYAHYGIAKAGIISYTRYLAQDLGPFGITVNAIAPGPTRTARLAPVQDEAGEELRKATALGRLAEVEDCANVVEFLVTGLSDYVTGCVIPCDGGALRVAS